MNRLPKVVATTTLDAVEWQNSTIIRGDVIEEITRLKRQPGKNINMSGSVSLVRSLLRNNLLDELWLLVMPIVVGRGERLFGDGSDQLPLQLIGSKTFSTGVVSLAYKPAGK